MAVLGLTLCAPGQAMAAPPVEHLRDSFSVTRLFDDCGFTIRSDFSLDVHLLLREAPNSDGQAFLGQENLRLYEVLTNPDTGEWFVNRSTTTFKEVTARQIEGTVWEFTVHDVGTRVFENSDGQVVLRDSGQIAFRAVFDTLGDGQPGGILLEEEVTGVHGSFPGFDVEFCDVATELIG
jgi:hypothetical protein